MLLVLASKKSLCKPRSQRFTLMFTSRSFCDSTFGFLFDPKFNLGEYFEFFCLKLLLILDIFAIEACAVYTVKE